MDTLYGVEVLYSKGSSIPVLRHVSIVKETPKYHIVDRSTGFLGYTIRVPKASKHLSFSPRHAWERYIERCNQVRMDLRAEAEVTAQFQHIAINELANLSEGEA